MACTPRIIQIQQYWQSYCKNRVVQFFRHTVYSYGLGVVSSEVLFRGRMYIGSRLKKILLANGLEGDMGPGQQRFIAHGCPVNQCSLTAKSEDAATADLILFNSNIWRPAYPRPPHQIWVLFMLESPYHTPGLAEFNGQVKVHFWCDGAVGARLGIWLWTLPHFCGGHVRAREIYVKLIIKWCNTLVAIAVVSASAI